MKHGDVLGPPNVPGRGRRCGTDIGPHSLRRTPLAWLQTLMRGTGPAAIGALAVALPRMGQRGHAGFLHRLASRSDSSYSLVA
jgi:hypothetical protein